MSKRTQNTLNRRVTPVNSQPSRLTRTLTTQIQNNEPGVNQTILPPRNRPVMPRIPRGQIVTARQANLIAEAKLRNKATIKYFETSLFGATATATFQESCLTLVPQGDAQSTRVADTIWVQSIELKFAARTANADIFNFVRLLIFRWNVSTALAIPTSGEIFFNYSSAFNYAFLNFERRDNYHVYKDVTFNLSGTATNPTAYCQHFINEHQTLRNLQIQFDPSATTATNHLFLGWLSDSTVTPFPIIDYNIRIWYYDE